MTRKEAINNVLDYLDFNEHNSFYEIGSFPHWDSGNYDDSYEYGLEVGRIKTLIDIFDITEKEVFNNERTV